ncbi:MAG TPA: VIT domain-containing protein [Thermoanaerobaculia bacterium]|nr:VIT domain-containing protein [Thermoanaerobaculia bacterium]
MHRSTRPRGVLPLWLMIVILALSVAATPRVQQTAPSVKAAPVTSAKITPPPKGTEAATAPISLSDPDGQDLILEDLSARTAIQGMLSLTELELRFRNPQARRIEGRFTCTLPANAAISRFAKEVNGQLMEGEVVERLSANQVYEQFLHQMRDPALLEQDQGNRFSARIFPIDPNGQVRILLSYTALLPLHDGIRTYSLPLRGMAKVGHFTFRAFVSPLPGEEAVGAAKNTSSFSGPSGATHATADVITIEDRDAAPQHDIELSWRPTSDAARTRVLRAGDFYLASFRPRLAPASSSSQAHAWTFYVDTSASSAEGASHRIHALETLLGALPASDRVQLFAFDQEIVSLGSGTAGESARSVGERLRARLFLGGTDLGALFRQVAKTAQQQPDRAIVIASDLVATLGSTDAKELNDAVKTIPSRATIHALILGSRQDAALAKALTAGRGRVIAIPFTESLESRAREAAASLVRPLGASFDVADASSEWVYPSHADDVQNGDEIIVVGKTKAGSEPAVTLRRGTAVAEEASSSSALPIGTFGPLLEREGYRAYLDYLAEREANEPAESVRQALANEQVKVSVEQRVVIPRTTMLVLETEWDYQRFGLDRRALASILVIDAGAIGRMDRRGGRTLQPMPARLQQPPALRPVEKAANATTGSASPRAAAAVPEPLSAAADQRVAESITVTSNAPAVVDAIQETTAAKRDRGISGREADGVPDGVAGGVVGGVVGGVIAGVPSGTVAPAPPPPIAPPPPRQAGQQAPAEPPASVPGPTAARVVQSDNESIARRQRPGQITRKENEVEWTRAKKFDRAEVDSLRASLAENPRDRAVYNRLSEVLYALGEWKALRELALSWQPFDPENPQVYEVLGQADEQLGLDAEAARANASIIEVAPAKVELLQRAGLLLLRTGHASIAEAPLRKALQLRPDRVNSYRHLALMLWREGRYEEAARVLESATRQKFPTWYGDAQRVIREELGYVYRSWLLKDPSRRKDINDRADEYNVDLDRRDALRVTLAWETDANDVDLHVVDPNGEECYYSHRNTALGLSLYEDITQGLGPEVIRTSTLHKGAYHVGVKYFSAGPMGVSRGIVVVLRDRGPKSEPSVDIFPFRLIEGGGDIRKITTVKVE